MKPVRLFVLSLALMGLLTACGGEEADPQSTAEPAPEPATTEAIQETPFDTYFDLSGLGQEALGRAMQTIDQESTLEDITVHVRQTLGDSRSLYIIFDVIYPGEADPAEYFTARLASGAVSDPSQAEDLPGQASSSVNGAQTQSDTMTYLAAFDFWEPTLTGQTVSLLIESPASGRTYAFTWTPENEGFFAQADLTDQTGNTVGSAALSPFLLTLEIPGMDGDQWFSLANALSLLGADGTALPASLGWDADGNRFFAQVYTPAAAGSVQTIQAGDYTGTFQ